MFDERCDEHPRIVGHIARIEEQVGHFHVNAEIVDRSLVHESRDRLLDQVEVFRNERFRRLQLLVDFFQARLEAPLFGADKVSELEDC